MRIVLLGILMLVAPLAKAQGVVDVHSHIIPPDFVSALQQHGATLDVLGADGIKLATNSNGQYRGCG